MRVIVNFLKKQRKNIQERRKERKRVKSEKMIKNKKMDEKSEKVRVMIIKDELKMIKK